MSKFYTWPNPTFPFRLYLDHPKCRIFIIENIGHNYDWFKEVKDNIRETDHFFVYIGWDFSKHQCIVSKALIDELKLNIDNFFIMHNSLTEMSNAHEFGFPGDVINHNAWLDEDKFKIINCDKKYDALYTARRTAWKRHELAAEIKSLACAAGGANHGNDRCNIPKCKNDPDKQYSPKEMVDLINESRCGLSLSETEGASFSTSEYLLCGIPVVSTPSRGGRDTWFNIDNSIIVEPTPSAVNEGVSYIIEKNLSPTVIRDSHTRMTNMFRHRFIVAVQALLASYGINDITAAQYFKDHFFHKMRNSMNIKDVISIFKSE